MSIFKGNSIYKTGAGGGGYKDGGALVDGDFIKVENNTVSSYDNENRDPVNFYFEPKDGEVLNGIIEFTTEVNATVNVYVLIDDVYYLLGNVGGDSVTAGNDYKINITGDSYSIEQVSGGLEPKYISLMGTVYGITKIGGLYWTTKNLQLDLSEYGFTGANFTNRFGTYWYNINNIDLLNKINKIVENYGFRVPEQKDVNNLISSITNNYDLRSNNGWFDGENGNGNTEFNAIPYGQCNYDGPYPPGYYNNIGNSKFSIFGMDRNSSGAGYDQFYISYNSPDIGYTSHESYYWENIRLCKDV